MFPKARNGTSDCAEETEAEGEDSSTSHAVRRPLKSVTTMNVRLYSALVTLRIEGQTVDSFTRNHLYRPYSSCLSVSSILTLLFV